MDDQTVYLWTLPMFHCNGWSHTWAVTAAGGTHVCLRKIDAETIISLIRDLGITHLSAAPVVLDMLASSSSAATSALPRPVRILTGGSVPPTPTIASIERLGFKVMHIYGLTESTGPSLVCEWQDEWNTLPREAQIANRVRQGVRLVTMHEAKVVNPETGHEVAADGAEMGELLLRGNTLMMGYLGNREATDRSFADGWFHTGDLAVRHPDGYVEIKDRAKDIIISGGENISSVEVEEVLFRHPSVREVAVVAKPDDKWGEHPCAFVDLKEGAEPVDADALSEYCRKNLAGFKIPKTFVFGPLPRTSTGKVQKHTLRAIARDFHPQESRA
jgi:fatty-acyl-CoA synthase